MWAIPQTTNSSEPHKLRWLGLDINRSSLIYFFCASHLMWKMLWWSLLFWYHYANSTIWTLKQRYKKLWWFSSTREGMGRVQKHAVKRCNEVTFIWRIIYWGDAFFWWTTTSVNTGGRPYITHWNYITWPDLKALRQYFIYYLLSQLLSCLVSN